MAWLPGWQYRKKIMYSGAAGAGTNYVVFVKVYAGAGVDGKEALTGGHNGVTAAKVYLPSGAGDDFGNVCFAGGDGVTVLDHFRDSYVAGTSALFAVEVADDLSSGAVFYVYWQGGGGVSSAAATFRRVISSGVVLALPMNEGAGATLEDYSGLGNDGTITNGHWVTTGKYGTGLSFDGDDEVTGTTSYNVSTTHTILLWLNPADVAAGTRRVFTHGGLYGYQTTNDFYFQFWNGVANKNVVFVNELTAGVWSQFGCIFDASDVSQTKITNGVISAKVVHGGNPPNDGGYIIGSNGVGGQYFLGVLSGVFVFNYALSDTEASDLYNFYPQCSSANTGSLYLRSFVNPEPQPTIITALEAAPDPNGAYTAKRRQQLPLGPPVPTPKASPEFMRLVKTWLEAKTKHAS